MLSAYTPLELMFFKFQIEHENVYGSVKSFHYHLHIFQLC